MFGRGEVGRVNGRVGRGGMGWKVCVCVCVCVCVSIGVRSMSGVPQTHGPIRVPPPSWIDTNGFAQILLCLFMRSRKYINHSVQNPCWSFEGVFFLIILSCEVPFVSFHGNVFSILSFIEFIIQIIGLFISSVLTLTCATISCHWNRCDWIGGAVDKWNSFGNWTF